MGRAQFKTLQSIFCFATDLSRANLPPPFLEEQPVFSIWLAMRLEIPSLAMPVSVLVNHVPGKHALAWLLLASPLSLSCSLPFSGTPDLLMEEKYFQFSEELKKLLVE